MADLAMRHTILSESTLETTRMRPTLRRGLSIGAVYHRERIRETCKYEPASQGIAIDMQRLAQRRHGSRRWMGFWVE